MHRALLNPSCFLPANTLSFNEIKLSYMGAIDIISPPVVEMVKLQKDLKTLKSVLFTELFGCVFL